MFICKKLKIKMLIFLYLFALLQILQADRIIHYTANYGKTFSKNDTVHLHYLNGTNAIDTLHVFMAAIQYPAIMYVHSQLNETAQVDWHLFDPDTKPPIVSFLGPKYVSGFTLSKIHEFVYEKKIRKIINTDDVSCAKWECYSKGNTHILKGVIPTEKKNKEIYIELDMIGKNGRASYYPKMEINPDSVSVKIELVNFATLSNSHLSIEYRFYSESVRNSILTKTTRKYIDDMNSPYNFKYVFLKMANVNESTYFAWKSIAYSTDSLETDKSMYVQEDKLPLDKIRYNDLFTTFSNYHPYKDWNRIFYFGKSDEIPVNNTNHIFW
ncbi:hypothetical protein A3Q56_01582 [Intoshia linei]|uniref:Dolichyl-diphosphooligosaccharide--protein glycosyltransferase subunit 1 n=1 Tax=Intoshia linei TaxID=1819745 RepID=A0A177B8Q6_9BILA|nr:hypothetical protein A3Q56_01582 [Intoshia linei]